MPLCYVGENYVFVDVVSGAVWIGTVGTDGNDTWEGSSPYRGVIIRRWFEYA